MQRQVTGGLDDRPIARLRGTQHVQAGHLRQPQCRVCMGALQVQSACVCGRMLCDAASARGTQHAARPSIGSRCMKQCGTGCQGPRRPRAATATRAHLELHHSLRLAGGAGAHHHRQRAAGPLQPRPCDCQPAERGEAAVQGRQGGGGSVNQTQRRACTCGRALGCWGVGVTCVQDDKR